MRRDSIFYKLFKQFPGLLFELVDQPPPQAAEYQFESVEVKETAFRIDGVFLPPANAASKVVFFAEVQFQRDDDLYHRFFSELFLFLYRHPIRYDDWFGVVIFASRSLEPSKSTIHRALLESGQVRRVYLDELGDLRQQPLGLALMLLTTIPETEAVESAKFLLEQAQQQEVASLSSRAIMDLVTTIMVYKFATLSREEIEAMLGLKLEETRVYREAKQEGRGEGREEGREEEARSLILRQLNRRVGVIPGEQQRQIDVLSLEQLEALAEALLDFSSVSDLTGWLQNPATS
ncbi:Rpn family recombination-promoting nuclease/putative transposase [Anabaena subtropica]|uniref:Rpn family recombination-promoting nuclease/putative transposase n=1 Tax=Anabaena subtropica FACHB-260 TaxID=2692884 RepID=A0ABR8CRU8_9NOST|nr:Rpn family recombination-promoting nuclease/putative transposase [Anabaena subtropica]MBD2345679.1 Rpn family recombination-promoting nuclease/putative transposase [Anabaena subtropica FACHB-260]